MVHIPLPPLTNSFQLVVAFFSWRTVRFRLLLKQTTSSLFRLRIQAPLEARESFISVFHRLRQLIQFQVLLACIDSLFFKTSPLMRVKFLKK